MFVSLRDGESQEGLLKRGDRIRMMATNAVYGVEQMGVFTPKSISKEVLHAGEVGFVISGIKELHAAKVGDTITLEKKLPNNAGPASQPLPAYERLVKDYYRKLASP